MQLAIEKQGSFLRIIVGGRLSSAVADGFQDELMKELDAKPTVVLVDFTRLTFIASTGLRALIVAAKRGQLIHLCGLNPSVQEVFDVSGLLRLFVVHPTTEEAMTALAADREAAVEG